MSWFEYPFQFDAISNDIFYENYVNVIFISIKKFDCVTLLGTWMGTYTEAGK